VLSAITQDYNLDVSQCQVVLLSQPDESLHLSHQASDFAFRSILVTSPTKKKLPQPFDTESVSVCAYVHIQVCYIPC